jgi:hypothetical protein
VDVQGHELVLTFDDGSAWVVKVLQHLKQLEAAPHAPTLTLDVEWLRRRCEDTLGYDEDLRQDSARQLRADVAEFDRLFPGLIPSELVPRTG